MGRSAPVVIAVDGRSGAGKSTLALELATALRRHRPVSLFHLEDLYPGWDGLEAGIARYVSTVLDPLSWGEDARWTAWDWVAGADGERRTTPATPVVVVEGVGAAAAAARPLLDAVVWVDADDDARRARALARDGEAYAPHWERWAAQERAWLAADPVREAADVVVANAADGRAPVDALRLLAELPWLQPALHPEAAAAGSPRLVHRRVRLPRGADAASLHHALFGASAHQVLLESSNAGAADVGGRNRFSVLADASGSAGMLAEHRSGTTFLTAGCARARVDGAFFDWLETAWGRARYAAPDGLEAGFALGWLGWLGYGLKAETGGSAGARAPGTADAALLHAGRGVVLDHGAGEAWLLALDADDAGAWLERAAAVVAAAGAGTGAGAARGAGAERSALAVPAFRCADTRSGYEEKVRAAQAEIREGNSYEVCLTTVLGAEVPAHQWDPWAAYLRLRERNPAPFAAWIRCGSTAVAGTSPERFLHVGASGLLRAEPIKGTRRRSADPEEDERLRAELASSPKDRAENVMIVDLLRNDLVRSADPSTLRVPRLCAVESYATVHQMVSTIDARLRSDASRAEAVAAAFPAGSMTGAPKISTMAILERLEDGRPRGIYSGAVGHFSHTGAAELSVVIRTLVMEQDARDGGAGPWRLSLGVGGAVTADSVPSEEWAEVVVKAYGVLSALGAGFLDADGLPQQR
ncbi:chorismate-binding protein [Zafaria sp. Z1313]|uniref:chorismate-binding protein n=1 Tax=unclassified Zafaria TaxID=2828765 RepID=UPI002E789179|nr:chorismate-binding protein [Zafaria sp. J156]MEE1622327.1 chorismate-binding protein [Zafaria sp. J156]